MLQAIVALSVPLAATPFEKSVMCDCSVLVMLGTGRRPARPELWLPLSRKKGSRQQRLSRKQDFRPR